MKLLGLIQVALNSLDSCLNLLHYLWQGVLLIDLLQVYMLLLGYSLGILTSNQHWFRISNHTRLLKKCWWPSRDCLKNLSSEKSGTLEPGVFLKYRGYLWLQRLNLSPTTQTSHQHILSQKSVSNIDGAQESYLFIENIYFMDPYLTLISSSALIVDWLGLRLRGRIFNRRIWIG